MRKIFTIFWLVLLATALKAATVSGKIVDINGLALQGVNVFLHGTFLGSASDEAGNFRIEDVAPGEYTLSISIIGYHSREFPIKIADAGQFIDLAEITLRIGSLQTENVVVTASKYEQNRQDVPSSLELITSSELKIRNTISIDDALKYVSGINMNSNQINIRGSSGYARGVGSRVLLLIDGVPYLTGDTREVNLVSLPIQQIERIEVIKGAGSALYGSSAIGGVVNVITAPIPRKPSLSAKLYSGVYDKPYYDQWEWTNSYRTLYGGDISYSRAFRHFGFLLSVSQNHDLGYKRNGWVHRTKFSGKTQWDLSQVQRLILNGNYSDQSSGNFLYWKDLQNALTPPDDQLDESIQSQRAYLSANYRYLLGRNHFINTRAIWFHNHFKDNIKTDTGVGHESSSEDLDFEIQYNRKQAKHTFTGGLESGLQQVDSDIFSRHVGTSTGLYIQDELPVLPTLKITAGIRFDTFDIDSLETDYQLNPKLGIVWNHSEYSAFRFSVGRGFRAPSIAEAYTSTTAGGLRVIPNTELKPERSFSTEVGWNSAIMQFIVLDVALFQSEYWDLIEGGTFTETGFIQFRNITRARVNGFEASLNWQALPQGFAGRLGYTYVNPRDVDLGCYLTYRPRHLLYNSIAWSGGSFQCSLDYRYISKYDRIDESFALVIKDAGERVDAHIVDAHIVFTKPFGCDGLKLSLQVNNLLQYNYVDLVGSVAPIRHFIFTIEKTF